MKTGTAMVVYRKSFVTMLVGIMLFTALGSLLFFKQELDATNNYVRMSVWEAVMPAAKRAEIERDKAYIAKLEFLGEAMTEQLKIDRRVIAQLSGTVVELNGVVAQKTYERDMANWKLSNALIPEPTIGLAANAHVVEPVKELAKKTAASATEMYRDTKLKVAAWFSRGKE